MNIQRKGLYKDPGGATCFTNGNIDVLTYTYNYASNRIQKISDATTGSIPKAMGFNPGNASGSAVYSYDANGNLTTDPYKGVSGMSLTYNHLNLPSLMNFGSDGTIGILYDHVGKKLRKTVTPTTSSGYTQDYVNGLEYRTNSGGGSLTLEAIYHAEGRITPNGSNYQYEYAIKDHLGNTRLTFADLNANSVVDVPGDILQENHYYPFGMNMNYAWMNNAALDNKYQYNGKELNDDFGLNWSDYGARWYDAAVGRWWGVDPLSFNYFPLSPYNYASDNPIKIIDPDGQRLYIPAGDGVALADIVYLVNKSQFKGAVTFNFVKDEERNVIRVDASFSVLSNETIDNDPGLALLRDVTSSDNDYLYEVSKTVTPEARIPYKSPAKISMAMDKDNKGSLALNLSSTNRGDKPKNNDPITVSSHNSFNGMPINNFDAQIVISPNAGHAKTSETGSNISRYWFTFHELQEAYYRTDQGMNYEDAHKKAAEKGEKFYLTPPGWNQSVFNPYRNIKE